MNRGKGLAAKVAVYIVLVIGMCIQGPPDANGQGGVLQKIGEAAASVYNKAAGATFTISKIEPVVKEGWISVYFTDRIDFHDIKRNIRFIPPVPIEWHSSYFDEKQNILNIRGRFKPGQQYVIVLPPNYSSANGKAFAKGVTSFTMPDLEPDIAFFDRGSVIERNSRQMLHVQLRNVSEVLFKGIRVPPALIPAAVKMTREGSSMPWNEIKSELGRLAAGLSEGMAGEPEFRPLTGQVFEDEQLFFNQQEKNLFHQFSIPLSFRRDKEKGAIELVQVVNKRSDGNGRTPRMLFRITDMGLTYKLSDDSLLIWATSLYTGRPLSRAALFGYTGSGEVAWLGRTGDNGLVAVKNRAETKWASVNASKRAEYKPLMLKDIRMIVAALPDDHTYVDLSSQGNVRPEGVQQQAGQAAASMTRGHVFTERGIYRPGETVYFKGTVREYKNGSVSAPASGKAVFRIMSSKNEEVYRKEIALSEYGTASDKFGLKTYFPLGTYNLFMDFGAGKDDRAARSLEVQEFRQPRHFVEIAYKRESRKDDSYINIEKNKELLNCEIAGKYYAGGPVKHGKVRWSIYHARSDYSRQDHPGYSFGHPLDARADLIESGESMLDEKGKITIPVVLGKDVLSGKFGIEVAASVIDFDGRASTESALYQADPDYLVGISSHSPTVKPGEGQTLSAIVIDRKGNKVGKGSVLVQVMERSYAYIQKRNEEGHLYSEQQQIWRSQLSAELPIKDDRAVFDFDFTRGGEFLISFTYKDASGREFVSATKYSMPGYYDYYEYEGGRREPAQNYGKLSLYPEKPLYTSGETIKVYVNPPREASAFLMTVEQGSLIEYKTIELKPGQQYIELPVKDVYSPNIYISLLGAVARSSFPVYTAEFDKEAPSFIFGTVNVEVKGNQQKIRIAVNEEQKKLKSLPGGRMVLNIATTDQDGKGIMSELAVAVVDESILSMTGFETPSLDLLGKFLLPLGVFTGDLRLDILKQTPYGFFRNSPLTGGDGEEAGPEAVSSKIRKDFNPVAYFNPSVRTDANGRASVSFAFPDTMTTYRVYAVACDKGSRFGSYQRPALVVKDFYMEPGLPAFMTRGDRFRFAVSAFNKTDSGGTVDFSVKADELISLTTTAKSYPLAGFDRTLIPIDGAVKKTGTTQMQFSGKFKDLTDVVEMKLPVNSGHVLGSDILFGSFRKVAEVSYSPPQAVKELRWEEVGPEEARAILTVSGSPFMRMSQGLRYFLRYPYG